VKNEYPDLVLRRWGFYSGNRLAFAGVAWKADAGELHLRFIEAEHHAHTATLPQRIGLEQLIRELARADIQRAMGEHWRVLIRFAPRKLDERRLAREVLGPPLPRTVSDS
jgi:hypothetical protein